MQKSALKTSSFFTKVIRSIVLRDGRNALGRILSLCYANAIETDPKLVSAILDWHPLDADLSIELRDEHFIESTRRRADFAIVHDHRVVALVEVKVDDALHKNQLRDYLDEADNSGAKFFIITRDPLTEDEALLLTRRGGKHIRHFEICGRLHQAESNTAAMIASFLRDNGMGGYRPISAGEKTLKYMARRLLPTNYKTGFGRLQGGAQADELPQLISALLNNAGVAGDWLSESGLFSQRFQTYPYVDPYWNLDALKADIDQLEGIAPLGEDYGRGGCLYFLATGKIRDVGRSSSMKDGYVELGFYIEWDKANNRRTFRTGTYVRFSGQMFPDPKDKDLWYADSNLRLNSDVQRVRSSFQSLFRKIKHKRDKMLDRQAKRIISELEKALE